MRARDWEPATARAEDNEIDIGAGRIPVIPHLLAWAMDPSRSRMVAVLGEFGMGKTVTCQLLTQRLLAERAKGVAAPLPLYLDLRELDAIAPNARFDLNELIDAMMRKRGAAAPPAADILEMARSEHVLVIFDGLDEVANKLSSDQALRLYRELLRIVPEAQWAGSGGPRLLVSCRDHYFKDLENQRAFLTAQHRAAGKDVEALTLLPFRREQIESYLRRHLPEADAAKALELIDGTYDLAGLASRPVLLNFIRTLIDDLAADAAAGRGSDLARLYDLLVRKTLARDELKHSIDLPEKQRLLEELALHLQARGGDGLHWEKLDGWLQGELVKLPKLERTLGTLGAAELFAQDLRNASFLVRVGEDGFRFSHTSLREYFLAGALHRAVREGRGEQAFEIEGVSKEAKAFLLRRHWREEAPERAAFEAAFPFLIKTGRSARVRKLAFDVWKLSHDMVNAAGSAGVPPASKPHTPATIDSAPATGTAPGQLAGGTPALPRAVPLPRPEVMDLSGLLLIGTDFRLLPLNHSIWTDTKVIFSTFDTCGVDSATFLRTSFDQTIWRNTACASQQFAAADFRRTMAWGCGDWKPQGALKSSNNKLKVTGAFYHRDDGVTILQVPDGGRLRVDTAEARVNPMSAIRRAAPFEKDERWHQANAAELERQLQFLQIDGPAKSEGKVVARCLHGSWVQFEETPDGHLLRVVACSENAWRDWRIAVEGTEQTWPLEDAMG